MVKHSTLNEVPSFATINTLTVEVITFVPFTVNLTQTHVQHKYLAKAALKRGVETKAHSDALIHEPWVKRDTSVLVLAKDDFTKSRTAICLLHCLRVFIHLSTAAETSQLFNFDSADSVNICPEDR